MSACYPRPTSRSGSSEAGCEAWRQNPDRATLRRGGNCSSAGHIRQNRDQLGVNVDLALVRIGQIDLGRPERCIEKSPLPIPAGLAREGGSVALHGRDRSGWIDQAPLSHARRRLPQVKLGVLQRLDRQTVNPGDESTLLCSGRGNPFSLQPPSYRSHLCGPYLSVYLIQRSVKRGNRRGKLRGRTKPGPPPIVGRW